MARRRAARTEASPRSGRAAPANPVPSSGVTPDAPTSERSPFRWRDAAIVAAVIFVLYAASAPRTVTLEDSGIFIMSSDVAGISHPPGYPIHSVLGKLFTLLPFGSVAFRVHLLSAFFGALTCGVLVWIADFLIANRLLACVVGLGYGVSREFWAQAIIAEVYTLNAFFFFVAMALALAYGKNPERRTLQFGALVVGLGMSHHWPLFFLSLPGLLALLVPRRREMLKAALATAPFFLLGLLPYAYLLVRSNMDPAISFYGPLDSLERFLFFVLRSGYSDVDTSGTAGWHDRLLFSSFLGGELAWQFTPLGGALAAFGFALQWRKWPRHIALGLLLSFLGSTLLLLFLLRRDFGYLEQAVFKVYPLLPYGVMALWLGLGIKETVVRLAVFAPRRAEAGAAVIGAAVVLASLGANAKGNWRVGYTWARDYGETVLGAVAEHAIIITTADSDIGPIGYLNRVEHVRPDVEIYNDKGLVFSNRLFRPPAGDRARTAAFRRLIDESDRPVYVTGELGLGYPMEDYGLFKKVLRRGEPSVTLHPRVLERCRAVTDEPVPLDMWTVDHRNVLLVDCGRLLGPLAYLSKAPEQARFQEALRGVTRHPYGKIGALEGLAERGNPDELLRWVGEAENILDENTAKQARGRLLFIRGFLENRKGAPSDAIESFRRSIAVFPDPRNGAVLGLLSLYAAQHRTVEYQRLRDTIFAGRGAPTAVLELDRSIGK